MKKFLLIAVLIIGLSGCTQEPDIVEFEYFYFDTSISIKVYDDMSDINSTALNNDIDQLLSELEISYSASIPTSKVNQVNNREDMQVTDEFKLLLEQSIMACEMSNGLYDPSSGALIDLWSINNQNSIPSQAEIDNALKLVGCEDIKITDNVIEMPDGYKLNFGSSVKGYAADKIELVLKGHGIENALINLGGNIQAVGSKFGKPFNLAIIRPEIENEFNENVAQMPLENNAMVTSGINQRYFVANDFIYHHIIDAKSGYPADNNLGSVTIITASGANADILSTTIFLMGLDEGYKYVTETEGIEAVFVTKDKKIYQTTDLDLTILDDSYELTEY